MAADDNKLERLTNLVLLLLEARIPIPLSQIANEIPHYPDSPEARRQAFERDKRLLREEGVMIEAVAINGAEQYGYRIDPATYFLPDLDLTPEESAALNIAVAGVQLGDESGGDALRKLGVVALENMVPVASLERAKGLDRLFQAIASKAEVRFEYLGEPRAVIPIRLRFSGGHWYLAGWSKERDAGRNFRVDRIDGNVTVGAPGSGVADPDLKVSLDLPGEPWGDDDASETTTKITVVADPIYAWRIIEEVGKDHVVETRADGSVVLAVNIIREDIARSWLLGFLDHIEVLDPPLFRKEMVEWLESIRDRTEFHGPCPSLKDLEDVDDVTRQDPPTQRRLRKLFAMLEWLASEGTVATSEVAARFSMTTAEVVAELELAACCGRPPYSPGELMDIIVDDYQVSARIPELQRTRQLTAAEGVAVAAAAHTILALPGADSSGALARALVKLESALGESSSIQVDLPSPPLLDELTAAAQNQRQLEVDYLATSSDELTSRIIDPLRVVAIDGRWYVKAFCHKAGALRTFRADSFKAVADIGPQDLDHSDLTVDTETFTTSEDSEVAIIKVQPGARWVADSIPILGRRLEDDGSVTVAISVSGSRWFERLLLQAGPDVTVMGPPSLTRSASEAASRVLEVY